MVEVLDPLHHGKQAWRVTFVIPDTWEMEAARPHHIWGQPGLHQKKNKIQGGAPHTGHGVPAGGQAASLGVSLLTGLLSFPKQERLEGELGLRLHWPTGLEAGCAQSCVCKSRPQHQGLLITCPCSAGRLCPAGVWLPQRQLNESGKKHSTAHGVINVFYL